MNETAQLAKFTAEMEFDKLPPQAVRMAKQCLLDWLGVALRGAHEEPARILRETALKMWPAGLAWCCAARSARRTCPHFARNCFKNVRYRRKHGV